MHVLRVTIHWSDENGMHHILQKNLLFPAMQVASGNLVNKELHEGAFHNQLSSAFCIVVLPPKSVTLVSAFS